MGLDNKNDFDAVFETLPLEGTAETMRLMLRHVAMVAFYAGMDAGLKRAVSIMGEDNDQ